MQRNTNTNSNRSPRNQGNRPAKREAVSSINPLDLVRKATGTKEESFIADSLFSDLSLHPRLAENIAAKGFERPTKIQAGSIPQLMEGRNMIGIANTGTGKTGAFLIPIIEKLLADSASAPSLIVTPTRELALQVEDEFRSLTKGMGFFASCFIGGTNVSSDIVKLRKKNHLVIGTPGRLLDLTGQGALNLGNFEILVLDEFDKMLDMGFIKDVERIIGAMRKRRQTILFSATMDKNQENLLSKLVANPVRVQVSSGQTTADRIDQDIIRVGEGENKFEMLKKLLGGVDFDKVLIFAETKHQANTLAKKLNGSGITADTIHGNKSQNYRVNALNKFKSGAVRVLVATDVAARGIDVVDVSHVINYQLPLNWDSYVHRIGRTGRAGKSGQAYTFID